MTKWKAMSILAAAIFALAAGCGRSEVPPPGEQQKGQAAEKKAPAGEAKAPMTLPAEEKKATATPPVELAKEAAKPAAEAKPAVEAKPAEEAKPAVEAKPAMEAGKTAPTVDATHRTVEKKAAAPLETVAPGEEQLVIPDLEPVEVPQFTYPAFEGKRIALIHTGNVIGELEPCG